MTEPLLPIALGRHDRAEWRDGRLHRLQLLATDEERITELAPLWAEPQVSSLSELLVRFRTKRGARAMVALADVLPRGLRVLQLGVLHEKYIEDIGGVDLIAVAMPFATALAELRVLSLQGPLSFGDLERLPALLASWLRTLAHARLEDLSLGSLGGEVWNTLLTLSPEALPALSHLRIAAAFPQSVRSDQICTTLAMTGWLTRLTTLALSGAPLTDAGVDALASGVRGRRLARLDITGTPVTMAMRAPLEAVCNELVGFVAIDEPEPERYIEHANKPDWGRGRIVRRFDDKIEVEFASVGVKVFKSDAPFLRVR